MTSESFQPWDLVVVPFPYSERLAEKRRPALVVSGERLHSVGFLWIAMVTGAGKRRQDGDIGIDDLAAAGLPGASMVRTSKLTTVEPERILRKIGALSVLQREEVRASIAGFLAR